MPPPLSLPLVNVVCSCFSHPQAGTCWHVSLLLASVINQVKGPNQVIIKQVKEKSGMKTLRDRKMFSGELIPVIFQVAGPENLFSEFIR